MASYIALNQRLEFARDIVALERYRLDAVDVYRRYGIFPGPRQTDADIRMLAFARTVDDAAHHSYVHVSDAGVFLAPQWHLLAQIDLNAIGEFLKKGARSASASRACDDERRKRPQAHRLQNLLRHDHFTCAIPARFRRERYPYRVADTLLQKDAHRSRRCHYAFRAHSCFSEPEMQRVITPRGKIAVDSNQVLYTAHLAGQHDLIGAQSELLCELCAFERRRYQRFTCDDRSVFRLRAPC